MWIDDIVLQRCREEFAVHTWVPEKSWVVLGSSNEAERECNLAICRDENIAVLRRAGGGGTVVLHPGCVVVTLGTWVRHYYQNSNYFGMLNAMLISALTTPWPALGKMAQAGISDIVIDNRKVAGTSLFRSRNYLLFQASILVEDQIATVEKYLAHPSKEPDYREGRSHSNFLSCLGEFVPELSAQEVHAHLTNIRWSDHLSGLGVELIPPVLEQIPHILTKASSNPA